MGTKIGVREGGKIPYCELERKTEEGGTAVYQPNHREIVGLCLEGNRREERGYFPHVCMWSRDMAWKPVYCAQLVWFYLIARQRCLPGKHLFWVDPRRQALLGWISTAYSQHWQWMEGGCVYQMLHWFCLNPKIKTTKFTLDKSEGFIVFIARGLIGCRCYNTAL